MITKLTYGVRTSQELPNQLVLQTRHRNAAAKNCTLNSKCNKSCRWTCCSDSVNFTEPCTNLAWCSTQVDHTLNWSTSTAPHKLILPSKPKVQTKILAQHSTEGNSPQFKQQPDSWKKCILHWKPWFSQITWYFIVLGWGVAIWGVYYVPRQCYVRPMYVASPQYVGLPRYIVHPPNCHPPNLKQYNIM